MIDQYGGNDTRVFRETAEMGTVLKKLSCVKGSVVNAPVAIIYDTENRWALNLSKGPRNKDMGFFEEVYRTYSALRKIPVDVDVIDNKTDLSGYKIVFAPMLYAFREDTAQKLRAYVAGGGTLIGGYHSGIVNSVDLCYMGETPHDLTDVYGLRREEIDALFDGESNTGVPKEGNALGFTKNYTCTKLCELVKTEGYGAEVLMTYADAFYKGYPVLTKHAYGKGMTYYICAHMDQAFHDDLISRLCIDAKIEGILSTEELMADSVPYGLEVTSRRAAGSSAEDGSAEYVFLQNFADTSAVIRAKENWEVLAGSEIEDGKITIDRLGYCVIKR